MRLLPLEGGTIRVRFEVDEALLLDQLTTQLSDLLQSYSSTELDPDPLFASLEVGGSQQPPDDPALARLFPDAHEEASESSEFRQLTEQGLLNRKIQDAQVVISALGVPSQTNIFSDNGEPFEQVTNPVEVLITPAHFPAWVRTLTALRLAVAARIGLSSEADHQLLLLDDDTRGTVLVFDWVAAILESVLEMRTQPPLGSS